MSLTKDATLLERLTFFSDAVFAIAITLLVIEIHPPVIHGASNAALTEALLHLTPNYVGFLVSFCVIGRFWLGHHRLFGLLARADDRLVLANLALLFGVAFLPFPTAVLSEYFSLPSATLLYAGWLVVLGLANMAVVRSALRPALLDPDHDIALARRIRIGAWLPIVVGLGAAAASFVGPLWVLLVLVLGPIPLALLVRRAAR
jgi:uncharacterized membrane protein